MAGKLVYEMVTDRNIEQLENNIIPWQKNLDTVPESGQ